MSYEVDHSKPFTKEQKDYFHQWSMDWAIEENERLHKQKDVHNEGGEVDLSKAIKHIEVPDPPQNPTRADGSTVLVEDDGSIYGKSDDAPAKGEFEETLEDEVNAMTVDELKDNLRGLDEPVSGNKDELQARLIAAVRKSEEDSA